MDWSPSVPKPADIIRIKVTFYYHYGIYVSDEEVIQFGLPTDPMQSGKDIRVMATDIQTFMCDGELETGKPTSAEKKKMRTAEETVATARSRIGEGGYDILHNNCEHFVNACVFGEGRSGMLEDLRKRIRQKLHKP